ncbi:MAG: 7TM diverse intracellular signaling domain-containing protein [Caldilineaceae bacterium]
MCLKHARWVAALFFLLIIFTLHFQSVYAADTPPNVQVGQIQVLEDRTALATLTQIQARQAEFRDVSAPAPQFGFTAAAYWLRIPVQNLHPTAKTFYLDVKNPLLDSVTLYVISNGTLQTTQQSGAQVAARQRPYLATTLVLPFPLAADATAELYVRVQSNGVTLQIPVAIHDEYELHSSVTFGWVLSSVLVSMLAAMLLYNLLLLTLLKSRLYLYYVLYLLCAFVAVASISGIGPAYLHPNSTWLSIRGIPFATAMVFALMILITREFVVSRAELWLNRWMKVLVILAALGSVGSLFWSMHFNYQMLITMDLVYPLFCFVVGVRALRQGHTEARFLIAGQISSWLALVLTGLVAADILPYHALVYQGPAVGAVIDAILLSLALADRIRILQRDRVAAEERARRNLEIRSEELERLVVERTSEIKTLHGILPICANCKKIRDDEGAWRGLEEYISHHTDAEFSHGICTDCMEQLYPEFAKKRAQKSLN